MSFNGTVDVTGNPVETDFFQFMERNCTDEDLKNERHMIQVWRYIATLFEQEPTYQQLAQKRELYYKDRLAEQIKGIIENIAQHKVGTS